MGRKLRIAVVGRGMIGAAAARHLAGDGHGVTLIGPGEPADRSGHEGVFGSHYDEGRITRLLDPHPVWGALAAASIARYAQIAAEGERDFYTEAGLLIGAPEGSDYLARLRAVRDASGVASAELQGEALRAAYPYLRFDDEMVMMHQPRDAGHVSPRALVAAQTRAAERHGARLVDGFATSVRAAQVTVAGETHRFDRVLVACGAFTNMVLERPLALKPLARTIALFRLPPGEVARLAAMPSLIYRVADGSDPYVLPPIRYPDGHHYLKIGGETGETVLESAAQAKAWFRTSGNARVGAFLKARIDGLFPGIDCDAWHTDSCAVTYTATGLPYIADLGGGLCVATGGCGGAAKSSDEIGRIAAATVLGQTDDRFAAIWAD